LYYDGFFSCFFVGKVQRVISLGQGNTGVIL
jgi:hypothetical protein